MNEQNEQDFINRVTESVTKSVMESVMGAVDERIGQRLDERFVEFEKSLGGDEQKTQKALETIKRVMRK
jgi:hypothetical protein